METAPHKSPLKLHDLFLGYLNSLRLRPSVLTHPQLPRKLLTKEATAPPTVLRSTTEMERLQLSVEAGTLFQEGLSLVLSRWSSLQLAVENEWGGRNSREKALKLASDVFTWFTQPNGELYIDDLEDLLEEAMLSLNTVIEDGSIGEVAYELMCMHEECLGGNYESIQILRASAYQARPVQHIEQEENEKEVDDGDMIMMEDVPETITIQIPAQAPKSEPSPPNTAEAEDGWTVASSKKKKNRGRKN